MTAAVPDHRLLPAIERIDRIDPVDRGDVTPAIDALRAWLLFHRLRRS